MHPKRFVDAFRSTDFGHVNFACLSDGIMFGVFLSEEICHHVESRDGPEVARVSGGPSWDIAWNGEIVGEMQPCGHLLTRNAKQQENMNVFLVLSLRESSLGIGTSTSNDDSDAISTGAPAIIASALSLTACWTFSARPSSYCWWWRCRRFCYPAIP